MTYQPGKMDTGGSKSIGSAGTRGNPAATVGPQLAVERQFSSGNSYNDDHHITEAYKQFKHRLTMEYKVCDAPENKSIQEIEKLLGVIPGNTSQFSLDLAGWCSTAAKPLFCCTFPCLMYYKKSANFTVPNNHFAIVEDHSGEKPKSELYGPGYHWLGLYRYLQQIHSFQRKVTDNLISSPLGDLVIITVEQGYIALFEYNGQSKILGPGLHMIRDTVQYVKTIQLDKFYIKVGPEKWITIPDQYDGIAINNGKTVVLQGGKQHHLFHENYKFAKLVPKIILTDRVVTDVCKYIENLTRNQGILPVIKGDFLDPAVYLQTKTKDGAVIYLDTMLFWEIYDTVKAAHKAMNVMEVRKMVDHNDEDEHVHIQSASRNIDNLRQTVLRFAKSCLAEAVGHVCLTDDDIFFSDRLTNKEADGRKSQPATAQVQDTNDDANKQVVTMNFAIQNFLNNQTSNLVASLNEDLLEYGVRVSKLTINNALPTREVQDQLDKQAKAKIDRNTALVVAETQRQVAEERMRTDKVTRLGQAKNVLEAARIQRETMQTEAEGIADRDRIIAQGKKDAAVLQEATDLGQQLAIMESIAAASKQFNSGKGGKVYIVGSPMEAITKVAGSLMPEVGNAV